MSRRVIDTKKKKIENHYIFIYKYREKYGKICAILCNKNPLIWNTFGEKYAHYCFS